MSADHSNAPAAADKSTRHKHRSQPVSGLQPSTTAQGKPAKPYPEFPLTAHPAGYWCKKIRGKLHYFGPRFDLTDAVAATAAADAALTEYLASKEDLHAGRKPRPDPEAITVKDVVNAFLNHKADKRDAGELSVRTFAKYNEVTDLLISRFGRSRAAADLRPDDFTALKNHMTKRWGPLRVADFIQHIRSVFKHGFEAELLDKPVRFGPGFARPSQKTVRLHRAAQGVKLYTREEVRRLLGCPPWRPAAEGPLRAMILLGVNCGFGNADCASLPLSALDLGTGWLNHPRPKTGVARRCPLWPETVQALQEALAVRPEPMSDEQAGLVFLSQRGTPLVSLRERDRTDGLAVQFGKLLKTLDINGRTGLGFYTLRHVFRTVADEARDQPAADHIMGHESPHMSSVYREAISDERLKAVTNHVRQWLFESQKAV